MDTLKPMMVRLPAGLDQRLAQQAADVMLPKAALARLLIRQQLDHLDETSDQEELDQMRVVKGTDLKGLQNPNTSRKKRKGKR